MDSNLFQSLLNQRFAAHARENEWIRVAAVSIADDRGMICPLYSQCTITAAVPYLVEASPELCSVCPLQHTACPIHRK